MANAIYRNESVIAIECCGSTWNPKNKPKWVKNGVLLLYVYLEDCPLNLSSNIENPHLPSVKNQDKKNIIRTIIR